MRLAVELQTGLADLVAEAVALLRRIRDASGDRIVSRNAARLLDSIENPGTGSRA